MNKYNIKDYLPTGKGNAISARELVKLMNFKSVRELQHHIHQERLGGAIILSTNESPGGYYVSEDPGEIKEFVITLENRAKQTIAAARSAKKYVENLVKNKEAESDQRPSSTSMLPKQ